MGALDLILLGWMLACAHHSPPVGTSQAVTERSTPSHKAREQYMLAILLFDRGACEDGARAIRVARAFDPKSEWLERESARLIQVCEEGE